MIRPARTLAAAVALAALGGSALAKAPSGVPTLEDVQQKARLAEAEKQRQAVEEQRDPVKDAIEAYKSKKSKLEDWSPLVTVILDAKSDAAKPYRLPAAEALLARFAQEDVDKNPTAKQVRIDIALELCELLKAPASDEVGLVAAEQVFFQWYRTQLIANRWKRDAKQRDRISAYNKIKKFLKNAERD